MSSGPQFAKLATADGLAGEGSAPRVEAMFYNTSAADIADGSLVGVDLRVAVAGPPIDLRGTTFGFGAGIELTNNADDTLNVVGIADQDIPIGSWGRVVTYGVKIGAKTNGGAIAAAAGVHVSGGQAGTLETSGAATGTAKQVGFAMTASYNLIVDGVDNGANTGVDVFLQLG